jgi:general secretion pathway protein E
MTIEDPVEYNFKGINQIQVNRAAEITFASGLRGVMRLDPDKIMVGEIRDQETAQSAIQSALTGHLVLSSIHANNAVGTFFRLIHLGIDRYMINASVLGMVSQRLLRRTCTHCMVEKTEAHPLEARIYERVMGEPLTTYMGGEGCTYCQGTGYQDRIGVFEMLVVNDEIRHMFSAGASSTEIEKAAIKAGMLTMLKDGMMKVKQGVTTPAEVMRNVYAIQ